MICRNLGVEANFGVIDANGGAAYYETDNFKFIKYDANDPSVAPNGYLIRTNFSVAQRIRYIRYATAENQTKKEKLSFEFLINDVPRCLFIHLPTDPDLTNYIFFGLYSKTLKFRI